MRSRIRAMACVTALVLIAAACGGDDDDSGAESGVIVIDGNTAAGVEDPGASAGAADDAAAEAAEAAPDTDTAEAPAAADAPDVTAVDATDEELLLGFTDCLRGEGIDVPDVETNPDGSPDVQGLIGPGGELQLTDPDVAAAVEACSTLLEGASFLPSESQLTELEDTLLEFAACLRDQGLDVDDPDLSNGIQPNQVPTLFGDSFDPDDPQFADEIAACQAIFAGAGLGGQ